MEGEKFICEKMYSIEESTCDIVGTFRRPQWFGARGIVPTLLPLITPLRDASAYF